MTTLNLVYPERPDITFTQMSFPDGQPHVKIDIRSLSTFDMLKSKGAANVVLVVSHGIFSKGTTLEGVDRTYTTDSFRRVDGGITLSIANYI